MDKVFWLIAALGAATFLIQCMMTIAGIQSKWAKWLLRSAAIVLLIFGWVGLVSLPEYSFFHLPFYPILLVCAVGYALVGSAIVFYIARKNIG